MKIQTLLLMTAVTMVTLVPRISAMCRFGTKTVAAQMASGMAARGLCTTSHTQFNASGSQSADSQSKKYNFADMFKAMRNNKKKIIAGLSIANDMYEYQFHRERFLKNWESLKDLSIFDIEQQLQQEWGNYVPCEHKELLDVFEELKRRMGVFENYKLYTCDKSGGRFIAANHQLSSRIIIFPSFFRLSLPEQIFTLCHELQHGRQVEFKIAQSFRCNDEYYRDEREKEAEQDAEATAARMMTCYRCLLSCQAGASVSEDRQDEGYYIKSNYDKHIEEAFKNDKLCKAHAENGSRNNLRDYLPQKESK